tara:strand:+ start:5992 stop:6660 length:669 start_codon:yes stop_codon:yes gene_type:complete
MRFGTPLSQDELFARADALSGATLAELAQEASWPLPQNLAKDKGYVGHLLECILGAASGSKPQQDFPHLDLELKTLPIGLHLQPLETTYITTVPLLNQGLVEFEQTVLYQKLKRVLWIPIQGEREIPLAQRLIGTPFVWQPCAQQWSLIRQDWEEIMTQICTGHIETLSARQGQVLQVRPKAAHGRALTSAVGHDGVFIQTRPRGFYLKKHFTQQILQDYFF